VSAAFCAACHQCIDTVNRVSQQAGWQRNIDKGFSMSRQVTMNHQTILHKLHSNASQPDMHP